MRKNQTDRILLIISLCGFALMSCSFLLMPLESVGILPGLLFWGGLLIGGIFQIILEIRRRSFFKAYHVKREKMQKPRNGLFSFGSNRLAMIADYAVMVSAALMALSLILTKGTGFLCYVFITTTLLAFCLHCILNGRIYFHVNNQNRIRQVLEQKKASMSEKGEGNK